jgi:hypothetical protein
MAETAWMASPVAGARILYERIGKSATSGRERADVIPDEANVSLPLSLVLSWTSSRPVDEGLEADGDGDA